MACTEHRPWPSRQNQVEPLSWPTMSTTPDQTTIEKDRETIAAYLRDDPGVVESVGQWIRTELRVRFPTLAAEHDDVSQNVHGKLVTIFREGRFRQASSLKTYVVRITRYTAVDALRKKHRTRLLETDNEAAMNEPSPYGILDRLEIGSLLREIILLAPAFCRDLWRLAYVELLSYHEISRRLALPTGTIKSRMWACRRKALEVLRATGKVPSAT